MMTTKAGIAEFIRQERQRLLQFVRRRLFRVSQMDVEDIVSDVILGLLRRADVFGEIESLSGYVYRSLENRMADRGRPGLQTVPLDDDTADMAGCAGGEISPLANPERELLGTELRERLVWALGRLTPTERAVWIATEIDGIPFRELADDWDEPIGTLLSRKSRATGKLRRLLADDAPAE